MIPAGSDFVIYGVARHPVTGRPTLRLNKRRKVESGSTSIDYTWGTESWPNTKVGLSDAYTRTMELNLRERDRFQAVEVAS